MSRSALVLIFCVFAFACFGQAPVINSFSPLSGNIGSSVTITGTGFDATAANNIVSFGTIRSAVTSASPTSLTVTVPAGAGYDPISVNINGLTGFSSIPFITTFAGGGTITANSFQWGNFPYPPGQYVKPSSIAIADMDGDGKSDIGFFDVGEQFSIADTISIFRNTSSNGTLSHAPKFTIIISGIHELISIYFQDIDADGKPDIIALNPSGYFTIYRNTSSPGNLSFASPVPVDLAGQHGLYAIFGDFDQDGKTDIAMKVTGDLLNIYKNESTPGSININQSPAYSISGFAQSNIITGDIDGDHKIDFVTTTSDAANISIYRNTSVGSNISFATTDLIMPTPVYNFFLSDLDGDQKQDIIASATGLPIILSIFKNTSTAGSLSFSARDDRPMYLNYIYDIDGDGKPDLLKGIYPDSIGVFKNTSSGGLISFDNSVNFMSAPLGGVFGSSPKYIYDLDNDGRAEIIAANGSDFEIWFSCIRNRIGAPQITSFTPTNGGTGTTIIISGDNLGSTNAVSIGGTAVTSFNILNSNTVSAIVAAGSVGTVIVTTPYGVDSIKAFNLPVISSFTPIHAGPSSISTVTINGINFIGVSAVSFGTTPAASFNVTSDTVIISTVSDTGSSGPVVVTNTYGSGSRNGFYFDAAYIIELCPPSATTIMNASISMPYYKWVVNTGNGIYTDISDNSYYSGSLTASLHLNNVPSSWYGYRYHIYYSSNGTSFFSTSSDYFMIKFVNRWNGSVSTAWEDQANWSCGAVPDSGTDVIINTGATITLNSNTTIRSLTISPGATLTIGSGFNLTILH